MFDISSFTACFEKMECANLGFIPMQVDLNRLSLETKEDEEGEGGDFIDDFQEIDITKLCPSKSSRFIISIDGTSQSLGLVEDGVIGATRVSVIERNAATGNGKIGLYGPTIGLFTNQNKDMLYQRLQRDILENPGVTSFPDTLKMVDRARNFLEKKIQLETVRNYKNSIIMFDGSLIGGTIDSPKRYMEKILSEAANNTNDIIAVSKNTKLILQNTRRSILSILENKKFACYCDITAHLGERERKYLGHVFVVKLSPLGETFRIDLPKTNPTDPQKLLSEIASTVTQAGYPSDLKLAHITCILSSIEVIELQAAAISKFKMSLKQDIRQKIFDPWR